jgi:hypothetical protein
VPPKPDREGKMSLAESELMEFVEDAYVVSSRDPRAMKMKIFAREERGEPDDILNFLGMKLEYTYDIQEQPSGRRYPREEKIKGLYKALAKWSKTL